MILHIISSIAEYEANLISIRTKQSLRAKKERGVKLGKPENLLNNHRQAIERSIRTNRHKAFCNENNKRAITLICMMIKEGQTYTDIAKTLNRQGFKTSKGCRFHAIQVSRLYNRYNSNAQ